MSPSLKANDAVSPLSISSRLLPPKLSSIRREMTSVCTGASFSRCWVPVPVTTISWRSPTFRESCAWRGTWRHRSAKPTDQRDFIKFACACSWALLHFTIWRLRFASFNVQRNQAGLLAFPVCSTFPALSVSQSQTLISKLSTLNFIGQWRYTNRHLQGITAAGTAPDFHRIPLRHAMSIARLPCFGCKGSEKIDSMILLSSFFVAIVKKSLSLSSKTIKEPAIP